MDQLLVEEVGESSSPPRPYCGFSLSEIKNDIYNKLVEDRNEEAVSNPDFRKLLDAHFSRLPPSYLLDVNVDKAEDVVLHKKILARARDPDKRPAFHCRFIQTKAVGNDDVQLRTRVLTTSRGRDMTEQEGNVPSNIRSGNCGIDFEPCSKLEDLNLDVKRNAEDDEDRRLLTEASSTRQNLLQIPIHEVIFSTVDRPKLLSQLSALLSDVGLNIREAHVFSTLDGYSLDVFVVDGWPDEETDGLEKVLEQAIARSERSLSGSSPLALDKVLSIQPRDGDWEIDRRLLKIEEKIASGYCGDLYRGVYLGEDVAVKVLKLEHLSQTSEVEFNQEVSILREVQHRNVVRFIGACTKPPNLCIVTEYMPGGNLYDYLHKYNNVPELPLLLKFSIDICKGMDYLHQNNIIHRDLKSANLLLDSDNVPYDKLTPIQAALGVRKGIRPELPRNAHPRLLSLMERCWEGAPSKRPSFSEIVVELEGLLVQVQGFPLGVVAWESYLPNGRKEVLRQGRRKVRTQSPSMLIEGMR
ncbi:hypothetical protein Taro_032471 [Colocasia esculenta]|uniref:non-specific serine/threonine protein kinase n=1 Tax=Colocasia esculenta TaxID=4460 RepID=A0A843W210_COLES|nr:hypothetical protein [Colocasia esculenta]